VCETDYSPPCSALRMRGALPQFMHIFTVQCFIKHRDNFTSIGFEVLITVTMKSIEFWVVMPCSSEKSRYFGGKYFLSFQG
jgi:hypothetical protein